MKYAPATTVSDRLAISPPSRLAIGCGLYAFFGGLVTLAGWVWNIPALADWFGTGISMMPNAAVGALAAGTALCFLAFDRIKTAAIIGVLPGLIGGITLFQNFAEVNLGIDTLLIYREWGQTGTLAPGRLGPPAAICLSALGMSLVLAAFGPKSRKTAVILGMIVICIAMLSVVGYAFGAYSLFSLPHLTAIALQIATALLALGVGMVASIRESEPMKTLCEHSAAGMLIRRVLPFLICACWVGRLRKSAASRCTN